MAFQLIFAPNGGAPVLGYGNTDPDVSVPNGMLFIRTDLSKAYIREAGAWKELLDTTALAATITNLTVTDITIGANTLATAHWAALDVTALGTSGAGKFLSLDANYEADDLGGVRVADTALTAGATTYNMFTTPIQVIAAPASGVAIEFLGAYVFMDWAAGTAYDFGAGEDLVFRYTDASGNIVSSSLDSALLNAGADSLAWVPQAGGPSGTPAGVVLTPAAALMAHVLSGNGTAGDVVIKIRVYYRLVRVASMEAIS